MKERPRKATKAVRLPVMRKPSEASWMEMKKKKMCLTLMEIEFRYMTGDDLVTKSFYCMGFIGFRIIH